MADPRSPKFPLPTEHTRPACHVRRTPPNINPIIGEGADDYARGGGALPNTFAPSYRTPRVLSHVALGSASRCLRPPRRTPVSVDRLSDLSPATPPVPTFAPSNFPTFPRLKKLPPLLTQQTLNTSLQKTSLPHALAHPQ